MWFIWSNLHIQPLSNLLSAILCPFDATFSTGAYQSARFSVYLLIYFFHVLFLPVSLFEIFGIGGERQCQSASFYVLAWISGALCHILILSYVHCMFRENIKESSRLDWCDLKDELYVITLYVHVTDALSLCLTHMQLLLLLLLCFNWKLTKSDPNQNIISTYLFEPEPTWQVVSDAVRHRSGIQPLILNSFIL